MGRGSQVRVGERPGGFQVKAFCVFEAGTDAVSEQHIKGPVGLLLSWLVGEKERSERIVFLKIVLVALHGAGAGERRTDETQADRLELAGRKFRRRVAGPEAVEIAGDDGEAGDLRVAHKIVDFSALQVGGAEIAAAHVRVAAVFRPRFLGQTRREILRIGAVIHDAH